MVLSAKTYNHQDNQILWRTVTLHEVWDQDDPSNPNEWDFASPECFTYEIQVLSYTFIICDLDVWWDNGMP